MIRVVRLLSLVAALVCCIPSLTPGVQPARQKDKVGPKEAAPLDETAADEKLLRDARMPTDAASLLKYLRDRTPKQVEPEKLTKLVKELGDSDFMVREKAYGELLTLGITSLEVLKQAANSLTTAEEIRKRAQELVQRIEQRSDPAVQAAVARLIGRLHPEGAAEVLLAYLPAAPDEAVLDDLFDAVSKVAVQGGKLDPAISAALKDASALRRAAAGAALVASGIKEQLPAAKAMLSDSDAVVRLRVAVALVNHHDASGVQPMIDCLKELPAEKTMAAEELLLKIAGDKAPKVSLGTDAASQGKCFEEWNSWWKKNGAKIDLTTIDYATRPLGFTLVVYQSRPVAGKPGRITGMVCELDQANNVRWKFEVPTNSPDATVIGPQRVLVVERASQRITIRDFKGTIKWEKMVPNNTLSAQPLPNGNIFVVTTNGVSEYDPTGKEVFHYNRNNNIADLYRGRKLKNGDVVVITNQGNVITVDGKTQKETGNFKIDFLGNLYGTVQELDNGNLVIPLYSRGMVAEYDNTGKQVWTAQFPNPSSAQRLANGNTLVTSQLQSKIAELDNTGREVWSTTVDGNVYLARRR
jgi:hypothetical protein